jgi:hypothetical protein
MNKEETMLEAAVKYSLTKRDVKSLSNREFDFAKKDFMAGAKWQEERMYSEEEVYNILLKHTEYFFGNGERMSLTEWFNQYKTKQDETQTI